MDDHNDSYEIGWLMSHVVYESGDIEYIPWNGYGWDLYLEIDQDDQV